MIYRLLGTSADEALEGTTALHMVALERGADMLRCMTCVRPPRWSNCMAPWLRRAVPRLSDVFIVNIFALIGGKYLPAASGALGGVS